MSAMLRARAGPLVRWTEAEVVAKYDGARKRLYAKVAADLLKNDYITRRDARVEAFVKAEKRLESKPKVPRMIQHRSPRFTLRLSQYLRPVAKVFFTLSGRGHKRVAPAPVFSYGLNAAKRAELLMQKSRSIPDCVMLPLDCKGFDRHVNKQLLQVEHGVYLSLYRNDPELARILSYQLNNVCITANRISYGSEGRRMSGDANTSLGNCILVYLMLRVAMRGERARWDLHIDGDDFVVFVERWAAARVAEQVTSFFYACGHELTAGTPARRWQDIEHNSSRIVHGAYGYITERNPWKVLATTFVHHAHFHNKKGGLRAFRTIAQGLLVRSLGLPVLQAFAVGALRSVPGVPWLDEVLDAETLYRTKLLNPNWHAAQPVEVLNHSRIVFEQVWGMSVEEQLVLEARLERGRPWLEYLDFRMEPVSLLPTSSGVELVAGVD